MLQRTAYLDASVKRRSLSAALRTPRVLVGLDGLEPSTSRLSGARSSHLSYRPVSSFGLLARSPCSLLTAGGDDGIRTHDPLLAGQVLSQLSYTPILMGLLRSLSLD